jgi:hypothetical protein
MNEILKRPTKQHFPNRTTAVLSIIVNVFFSGQNAAAAACVSAALLHFN